MASTSPTLVSLLLLAAISTLMSVGCGASRVTAADSGDGAQPSDADGGAAATTTLRLSEVVSNDDGTTIDEDGEIEDWIELVNTGDEAIELSNYSLRDANHSWQRLPAQLLAPGATVLFWADEEPTQGDHHLRFKLSAAGDHVLLGDHTGRVVDEVVLPALELNQAYARFPTAAGSSSFAFTSCNYATPGRPNGQRCGPPVPPGLPPDVEFAAFMWPPDPAPPPTLAVTRLALFPARFVEVENSSKSAVELAGYLMRLQQLPPGAPLPDASAGVPLQWPAPTTTLAPGGRVVVPIPAAASAALDADPDREGVLSIFHAADPVSGTATAVERVDFMRWPDQAVLMRERDPSGRPGARLRYCEGGGPTQTAATDVAPSCTPLAAREVGDRLRHVRTPHDYAALSAGNTELASRSVKFVIDMEAGDSVHLLSSRRWDLHYRFARERIYRQPALDRCDHLQAAEFYQGWVDFSLREYFTLQRRFLLGTLVRWGGGGLGTVEFAVGDIISAEQMRRAFFAITSHLPDPRAWAVRPQAQDQVDRLRAVEGTLPIVDAKAPFRNQTFQPLVAATGYGVLRFVAGAQLGAAQLGPDIIVITDEVPNDIPLVGGLITEAFQTPLAHVAVLSKNRGTPNMALLNARTDSRLTPFLDKLIRLEVTGAGFTVAEATAAEAQVFWDKLRPQGPRSAPRLDTTVVELVDLTTASLDDLPAVGAKAAQIGELFQLARAGVACPQGLPLPRGAFAIPVSYYAEHFERSGAAAILAARGGDSAFLADPAVRSQVLSEMRAAIAAAPLDTHLQRSLRLQIEARFGAARVRLRSSSNTEDLPGFTGAGLYASVSAALDDPELDVAVGVKTVWASLWQPRAFDEREQALIDHGRAAMGILVEPAFTNERANGVAISRNVLDPIYGDAYYFNAQAGEASVTNPAPGVVSEQGTFHHGIPPRVEYVSRSSLVSDPVLTPAELEVLMCSLGAIHQHFRRRLDPRSLNRWFAMDIEWKFLGPARQLVIKQARPYSFGRTDIPTDCREF